MFICVWLRSGSSVFTGFLSLPSAFPPAPLYLLNLPPSEPILSQPFSFCWFRRLLTQQPEIEVVLVQGESSDGLWPLGTRSRTPIH